MSRIPRMARGRRNRYFEAEGVDELLSMVLELTAEVSVMRERQYALERVLESNDLDVGKEVENWQPTQQDNEVLNADRQRLISSVLRTLDVDPKAIGGSTSVPYPRASGEN